MVLEGELAIFFIFSQAFPPKINFCCHENVLEDVTVLLGRTCLLSINYSLKTRQKKSANGIK